MSTVELNVPKVQSGSLESLGVPIEQIPQWIAGLPLANPPESANRLHTLLAKLNRHGMGARERLDLLAQLEPVVPPLAEALRKIQLRSTFPLGERPRHAASLIHSLFAELAAGYKLAVLDLLAERYRAGRKNRLAEAAARATRFIALLITNCYLQYAPEPRGVWSDLHRLYAFTHAQGINALDAHDANGRPIGSVEHLYKSVSLLALTNPLQLMLGEAQRVFELLSEWADTATLTLLEGRPAEGTYYADLESDSAPRYAWHQDTFAAQRPLAFGVEGLLRRISQRLREVMAAPALSSSLSSRQERDLLLRLERAWTVRRRRRFPRTQHVSQLNLAASLSASHHYVSGAQIFNPEEREVRIHQQHRNSDFTLKLIPENYEPWKNTDRSGFAVGLANEQREASFRGRDLSLDVWHQIYVTKPRPTHEHPPEPIFPAAPLFQRDESIGGLSLLCSHDSPLRLQVGELVVYETGTERDPANWRVGAVRWMLQRPDRDLEVGIKRLARDALAVAVRGVRGVGRDGGYIRALLIPRVHPRDKITALIVPAGMYDLGSVLVMNINEELLQAQLTRRLETTGCYSVFSFRLVVPMQELPVHGGSTDSLRRIP